MTSGGELVAKEIATLVGAATVSWLIMLGLSILLGDALMVLWHWTAPHLHSLAPAARQVR